MALKNSHICQKWPEKSPSGHAAVVAVWRVKISLIKKKLIKKTKGLYEMVLCGTKLCCINIKLKISLKLNIYFKVHF